MKESDIEGQYEVRYDYLLARGAEDPDIIETLAGPEAEKFRFTGSEYDLPVIEDGDDEESLGDGVGSEPDDPRDSTYSVQIIAFGNSPVKIRGTQEALRNGEQL